MKGWTEIKKLNLRKLYPLYYTEDCCIEVSDEVAEQIEKSDRTEHAYRERTRVHKAYYSLDAGDGIEKDILFVQMSPQELYTAINELPEKQAKRIYARFFQSMSISDIARIEGVAVSSVKESIDRGLKKISKILKNI